MSAVNLPYPSGLPVGDGWLPTCGSAEVVFPYEGLTIAGTRRGGVEDGLQPTMLLDVADGEPLWDEEVFGPVVCVRRIADVERAFDEVNRSRYGLHASIWTASLGYAFAALRGLDVGGVVVNELPGFRSDTMPHCPVKDSGTGCEGPRYAIEEFTVTRMAGDPSMTSVEPEHSEGAALDLLDRAATKTFAADVGPVDALVFTPAANVRKHVLTTGTRNSTAWLC